MSLARAFTKRIRGDSNAEPVDALPRSCTVRYAPGTIKRAQISLPTELLSTTNMDAMNAPDVPNSRYRQISNQSSASSLSSPSSSDIDNSSDFLSSFDKSLLSSDAPTPVDMSPITPGTPSQVGGADFFTAKTLNFVPTPMVPQRAPSHSKRAHLHVARQRSISRMSPPPTAISANAPPSIGSTQISSEAANLFSRELAKVNEVAEEFGAMGVLDAEEKEMLAKGLRKFSVSDYMREVVGHTDGVFGDDLSLNPWI